MKYNLPQFFLSYSHKDYLEFNKFISILINLTYDKWEIWKDDNIKIGEKWNLTIYQTIEGTQFSILCLSDNFLDSLYIKENEIPIIIYKSLNEECRFFPFLLGNCTKEKMSKLSEYQIFKPSEISSLEKTNTITSFSECLTEEDKIKFVKQFISKVNEIILTENIEVNNIINWRNDYIKKLKSSIIKNINPLNSYHSTRIGIADVSSEELISEIPSIFQAVYQLELESGNNYLRRAIKLFGPSSAVYAVSLNNISTFWKEKESNYLRSEYLKAQSNNENRIVFRLFVFKNINEIKDYKDILELHYKTYGNKNNGGVFLCTINEYNKILSDFTIPSLDQDLSKDSDFAILDYPENNSILIKLKSKSFNFTELTSNYKINNKNQFTDFCKNLITLKEWDLSPKYNILKWGSLNIKKNKLIDYLKPFTEEINKPTKHFLFLNNKNLNKDQLRKSLMNIKDIFDNSSLNIKILKVEFLEKESVRLIDPRFGSRLKNTNNFEYCLIIDFADVKDLKSFYNSIDCSIFREEIYKIINPKTCDKFEILKKIDNDEEKIILMEDIEATMNDYISRMDFVANDPIDEVVDFLLK